MTEAGLRIGTPVLVSTSPKVNIFTDYCSAFSNANAAYPVCLELREVKSTARMERRMAKTNRFTFLGLVVALAIGGTWVYSARLGRSTGMVPTAPQLNFQAPQFSLPRLDGRQTSLSELRGRDVLVNFWATWCVPCRVEMLQIQAVYETHRARDFVVLAINEGEDAETVAHFVKEFKLTFPVFLDRDQSVGRDYDVRGLPISFFIDSDGIIRASRVGEMSRDYMESQLTALGIPALSDWASSEPSLMLAAASPEKLNMDVLIPPGRGHDQFVKTCLACHDALTFGLARKTRDGWMGNRANHAKRFASLSDAEVDTLYEYVVEKFDPTIPISNQLPQGYVCGT